MLGIFGNCCRLLLVACLPFKKTRSFLSIFLVSAYVLTTLMMAGNVFAQQILSLPSFQIDRTSPAFTGVSNQLYANRTVRYT
ncbi:MAG: hypothetical protein Q8P72_06900, partial [Candidatus Roizmanbacteria bacterium]|nr:hypothetical protein [Candidatus Roizmanbacteria bacterium]